MVKHARLQKGKKKTQLQAGPKPDTNGKNGKTGRGAKVVNMLKRAGPKTIHIIKNGRPPPCPPAQTEKMVKPLRAR